MNRKANVIVLVILIATVFALFLWLPPEQNKPETTEPSPITQENILPNQKRIEEIVAETERIATENNATEKKSAEEEANQKIHLAALQKAIGCTGKEWEIHNCNNLLKRLSTYPDIAESLQKLTIKGVRIRVKTSHQDYDGDLNVGIPVYIHKDNIYISVNSDIVIETGTEIEKIKKFLGLPEEKNKKTSFSYTFQ